MESDFTSISLTHRKERFKTISLIKQPPKIIKTTFFDLINLKWASRFHFQQENKAINGKKFHFDILLVCLFLSVSYIRISIHSSLYSYNKQITSWLFVCTIFIIHSLWRIAKLTRSLRSLVRLTILHNSWIKIVRTHQPWSNLYISNSDTLSCWNGIII